MNTQVTSKGTRWLTLPCVVAIILFLEITPSSSHAQAEDQPQKLEKMLRRFPDADTNKDGKLTIEEAKAHLAATPTLLHKRKGQGEGDSAKMSTDEDSIDPEALKRLLQLYEAHEFKGVKYRLLKPIDLVENPGKKYPLILSLHGAAGKGNDNSSNLRAWNQTMAQEELRRKHPCFVVVPQSPAGPWQTPKTAVDFTDEKVAEMPKEWQVLLAPRLTKLQNPKMANLHLVFDLLDALAKEFKIDTDRVYVLGHSGGGFGTWTAVIQQPDRFAAAITSAGWIVPWADPAPIKDLPMWSFQGARDKEIQTSMGHTTFERMKQLEHNLKFTKVAKVGHGVGSFAFTYTGDTAENTGVTQYASEQCDETADVWDWLFSKKRVLKTASKPTTPRTP
jgi:predicted peptidase